MRTMHRLRIITLTTDFGLGDGYVGTMKGVMLNILPQACLVDITHEIAPQDVRQTAYVLYTAYRFFPPQAIHLIVVDPGVGSARRPIAVRLSHGTFVGPDNGVFSYVMVDESVEAVVELVNSHYRLPSVSQTFHGRDIFAPAAAHLAAGVAIEELGPTVPDPITLSPPRLEIGPHTIGGEVLHTDHFGNVITSIGRLLWRGNELLLTPAFHPPLVADRGSTQSRVSGPGTGLAASGTPAGGLPRPSSIVHRPPSKRSGIQHPPAPAYGGSPDSAPHPEVRFQANEALVVIGDPPPGGQEIRGVCRTYADVEPGDTLALVGSEGHLEIAVREGSGARRLGLQPGDPVELRY